MKKVYWLKLHSILPYKNVVIKVEYENVIEYYIFESFLLRNGKNPKRIPVLTRNQRAKLLVAIGFKLPGQHRKV